MAPVSRALPGENVKSVLEKKIASDWHVITKKSNESKLPEEETRPLRRLSAEESWTGGGRHTRRQHSRKIPTEAMDQVTVKVFPSAEELNTVTNLLYCPEDGCGSIFKSESNLNLHLAKRHKYEGLAQLLTKRDGLVREYHCPEKVCAYHHVKSFKNAKLLKQHYLKVHSSKDIYCEMCSKGFATEASRNAHQEYCGIDFKCCECEMSYHCYDTLNTHGRRKKHQILPKSSYKLIRPSSMSDIYIGVTDKSSQTDLLLKLSKIKNTTKDTMWINTMETQTYNKIFSKECAETQTIGDYFGPRDVMNLNLKNNNTQTANSPSELISKSCNTSLNIDDIETEVEKASLGTQTLLLTSLIKNETSNEDLIHEEFMNSSCQTSFTDNLDTLFFNCNNETQTDSLLDFDLLMPDLYTNMCTQTCSMLDLELSNNHTQTAIDDVLRSVGSQTMMSVANPPQSSLCKSLTNNETQTDA